MTETTQTKPADPAGKKVRKTRSSLSSVSMAMRLLKVFSERERELGVSELAARLGVAKSTVHRLAVTLVSEGMLEQNPQNGKYRLSIELFHLGALVRQRMDLSAEARPFIFELRDKTRETVLLGVPSLPDIMYIYNLESPQAISVKSDLGVKKPAFCTAVGRAILAYQTREVIDGVLALPMAGRTAKTITNATAIRDALVDVVAQGYAIDDEESENGMRCVAAPVWNAGDEVVGAVALAGPVQRLSVPTLHELAADVRRTARAISQRLGQHASFPY